MRDFRRVVVACVVGSFGVSALLGIVALLGGGEFGETEANILLTTVIVGVESLALLCYLTLAGHRAVAVGLLGGAVSLVCAGTAASWVWGSWQSGDEPWRLFTITLVVALTLVQASLLIRMADRDRFRAGLVSTLALAAIVAALLIGAIVSRSLSESEDFWRIFGVVAILDVLGTIVVMAVAAVVARSTASPAPMTDGAVLTAAVQQRVSDLARERGTTPDALVTEALDALPARREPLQQ